MLEADESAGSSEDLQLRGRDASFWSCHPRPIATGRIILLILSSSAGGLACNHLAEHIEQTA